MHLFLKSQLFCEQISLKLFVFVAFSLKFVTGSMFKSGWLYIGPFKPMTNRAGGLMANKLTEYNGRIYI